MSGGERELVLRRRLEAPRAAVWRCWTEPGLMMRWFTPKPWETVRVETDLRPGGNSLVVMQSPEGDEIPNRGVYLEVVPQQRLVFTDAFTEAWKPAEKPFMTAIVEFADADGGGADYVATARHWTVADREAHEKMGLHEGWGKAADQLEDAARRL